MPTVPLTDARIRALKPTERAQKVFDRNGLHLFVSPTGAKTWRIAYRFEGKPKTMGLGAYPDVSLAEARVKLDEARIALRAGNDPMAPRREKLEERRAVKLTLAQANTQFWEGRRDISDSYRENAVRGIEMHLCPTLGDRDIGSITRADLLAELKRMDAKGLLVYVRKVRMWVSQVFDWAVEGGHAEVNPAASINPKKAFSRAPVVHFAAVPVAEVGALFKRIAMEAELDSVLACRFLAYTWVRTNEMRMAKWSEIEGSIWRIPAGKMKMKREHIVPLTPQALAVLEKMRARSSGSEYVFAASHRNDRPISENTVLALLARLGYKGLMTGHGFRTIASTWANEADYREDAIERQLAHAPTDKVRDAYNRAEYMPERLEMMKAWADWLDDQEAG